ncbi:MAG TPA: lysine--tRNA ligase [Steroidobacteraceae bacterium]
MADSSAPTSADTLWFSQIADKVLASFPNEARYTCAAGISPSGIVHFGNFRDVITAYAVACELRLRGKNVRLLFSWDNFDRFRKVPKDVDQKFSRYIGYPLTGVPDPWGKYDSYARRYEVEFEDSIRELDIELDYRYQTKEYQSGRYADQIAFAMRNREKIAAIQLRFKTDKANEEKGIDPAEFARTYWPIVVYSRFTGTDKTEIVDYDGNTTITYRCNVTGKTETVDFRQTPIVKLPWKIDWPMRWGAENVNFEPGGKDHATPGGSYDVSAVIAREVFGREPPVFQGYEFVGIQGGAGKMSGSKGGAVSPAMLLEIYEPSLLKWLYLRRAPTQSFNLAFDSEVIRQYDEFDRETRNETAEPWRRKVLGFSGITGASAQPPIPFKQAVGLGQIVQWDTDRVVDLEEKTGTAFSRDSIERRLPKARNWLTTYNPDEIIALRDSPNLDYAKTMDEKALAWVRRMKAFLATQPDSIAVIEAELYAIPKDPSLPEKEIKAQQRKFFKDVYNLLIGKETGPRLATFLWATDRSAVNRLLEPL